MRSDGGLGVVVHSLIRAPQYLWPIGNCRNMCRFELVKCHFVWQAWHSVRIRCEVLRGALIRALAVPMAKPEKRNISEER